VELVDGAGLDLGEEPPEQLGVVEVEEDEADGPDDEPGGVGVVEGPVEAAGGDGIATPDDVAQQDDEDPEERQLDEDLAALAHAVPRALVALVAERGGGSGHAETVASARSGLGGERDRGHGPSLPSRRARAVWRW